VIDAASVTWEPSVPRRRPPLWPAIAGLSITALVIAMGFAVLIAGLRVRYTARADKCAAVDIGPLARVFGKVPLKDYPDVGKFDCLAGVGDSPQVPKAIVGLSVSYRPSMFEARLAYEASDEAGGPGSVKLLGGKRGRLLATPLRAGQGCVIRAVLQDVNVLMTAQLTYNLPEPCSSQGAPAQALSTSMRLTLAKLG
jgi:hypothetical protein